MTQYTAVQFKGTPGAEIVGQPLLGLIDNLRPEQSREVLDEYGLTNIVPDQWYSHQISLDIAQAIHESPNGMEVLVAMGRGIGKAAIIPDNIQSLDDLMDAMPHIYQMNLRNIHPEEKFIVEEIAPHHYRLINNTPSSNQLIYGMLWEMVMRFRTNNNDISLIPISGIEHDATEGAVFEIEETQR